MHRAALALSLATVCLAADRAPDAVLARLRQRVADDLRRMPNYTCVETISRHYFKPEVAPPANSCDALGANNAPGGSSLLPWSFDRLRLDVAVSPSGELFSWAGAGEFEDRELTDIVGGGPIGTGAFGAFLTSIFGAPGADFHYVGENYRGMEFHYRIPREL